MKRTSKIFGALALSAALTAGTALPAFAADEPDVAKVSEEATEYTDTDGTAPTPYTDINLRTTTKQVNCTLPLNMTVVASVDGGDITCPTPGIYKITNNVTTGSLYITHVEVAGETGWNAAAGTDISAAIAAPAAGDKGNIFMSMTPTGFDAINLAGSSAFFNGDVAWKVGPATSDTVGTDLALNLAGKASKINGVSTDLTAGADLMKVSYTVSAMDPSAYTSVIEGEKDGNNPAIPAA